MERWVDSRNCLDGSEEEKNFLPLAGVEPWTVQAVCFFVFGATAPVGQDLLIHENFR
jgi:hypothetical protein